MFAGLKTKKIFKIGAATYEHARYVNKVKGMDMVHYLRARRHVKDAAGTPLIGVARKNLKFVRAEYLKRKRHGLRPYKLII